MMALWEQVLDMYWQGDLSHVDTMAMLQAANAPESVMLRVQTSQEVVNAFLQSLGIEPGREYKA